MLVMSGQSVNMRLGSLGMTEEDTLISYLPSAHSFEAGLFATATVFGSRIGFYGGDPLKLISDDIPALKPTLFPSVPRVYNKVYGKIKAGMAEATGCKAWLINKAVTTKMQGLQANNTCVNGCWDAIVFKKIKLMMGGQVKCMITGSAPIAKDVLDFLKICFCVPIVEGYGMTETAAGSVVQKPNDMSSGNCGGPVANVKIKLRDIPEMNYLSTSHPPKGEILFAGSSIMKGYFKNEEKTKEMMPDGEWLCSGDVGVIHPNGSI